MLRKSPFFWWGGSSENRLDRIELSPPFLDEKKMDFSVFQDEKGREGDEAKPNRKKPKKWLTWFTLPKTNSKSTWIKFMVKQDDPYLLGCAIFSGAKC